MNNFEAKRQAKTERFKELAEKNRKLSGSLFSEANKMASVIPMGQPILVGHHSEKSDRNYRKRIDNKVRKAIEIDDKADYYERKAVRTENNTAIFSDDPAAGEKLAEKIQRLETNQDAMKEANKIIRSIKISDAEKIGALIEIGFSRPMAISIMTPDWLGRTGFASYQLQNNSANINRLKKRLGEVQKAEQTETSEIIIGSVKIVDNTEENRLQLFFSDKPKEETRTLLKRNGFRWSPTNGCWQRHRSNHATRIGKEIAEKYEG